MGRVVVSLVSQRAIKAGEEITVDYTGRLKDPLWFHCLCPVHKEDNNAALRLLGIKKELQNEGKGRVSME
uniref:SET domain-containing protein n=1 Tax=Peronospora matthiolae TaxID=2874970 RepID=A0AAV1UB79_9STRA